MEVKNLKRKLWFIIAHSFNADGVAASQTITDRLPFLKKNGVEFVVLSGCTGIKALDFPHYRVISPSPSGIRYEMRFVIKNKFSATLARGALKTILMLLCLPFYLFEKIFIHLDSQWSWFISASVKGCFIVRKHRPDLLYSTAGPSTTHLAAYILNKIYSIPWMAEVHDPFIRDDEKRRWHKYYFNRFIEKIVCKNASIVIYFTNQALQNANRRHPIRHKSLLIRPGANPPAFDGVEYVKRNKIHFGHFGSLSATRNLDIVIKAIHRLTLEDPSLKEKLVLDIYGSELDAVSKKSLKEYPLEDIIAEHGRIEFDPSSGKSGRQIVLEAMKAMDVLVLLHGNDDSMSQEYIPSKLYEYLLMGRPVLGLVTKGTELEQFLNENGHLCVNVDSVEQLEGAIKNFIIKWESGQLNDLPASSVFTVEATVNKLIDAVSHIEQY